MEAARLKADGSIEISELVKLFPDTSFPATGANDDFYHENGLHKVVRWIEHDASLQVLKSCEPYINNDTMCYTVKIELLN